MRRSDAGSFAWWPERARMLLVTIGIAKAHQGRSAPHPLGPAPVVYRMITAGTFCAATAWLNAGMSVVTMALSLSSCTCKSPDTRSNT
jgi:hypothetical protein